MARTGLINSLPILRISAEGAVLDGNAEGRADGDIFLPRRLLPEHSKVGDRLKVFIYRDSTDRLAATTEPPVALLHDIAVLRVVSTNRSGAFLHWGLPKDLLLPWAEVPIKQKDRIQPGHKVAVRVFLDSEDRLTASARLDLQDTGHPYQPGEQVAFTVLARTPLGFRVAVEHRYAALIHQSDIFKPLFPGSTGLGHVKTLREDGLLTLGVGNTGARKVQDAAAIVLDKLAAAGGTLALGDHSPPELIYQHFGISKKAFKQAIGGLYKAQKITILDGSIKLTE